MLQNYLLTADGEGFTPVTALPTSRLAAVRERRARLSTWEPVDLSDVAIEFGATHVLIDECEITNDECEITNDPCVWWTDGDPWVKGTFYGVPWSLWYEAYKCVPVVPDAGYLTVEQVTAYYTSKCNDEIPDCEGRCVAWI